MHKYGDIRIDPDPAIEGQLVTITLPASASGPWYVSLDPSGTVTEVTPDGDGQVEIMAPGVGGESFTVTNFDDPPTGASFDIVSQSGHGP
ncbi:MAG: hypothetical protein R3F56_18555 [Planctomycetota bacterium]